MNESTLSRGPIDRFADACVRWIAPIAVTITVAAVYWTPTIRDPYDLQLSAPAHVAPGNLVPLRAYLFVPDNDQDAETQSTKIKVRISSERAISIEETTLTKISPLDGSSGMIRAPIEGGAYSLIAIAEQAGRQIAHIRRSVRVSNRAPSMVSNKRPLDRLQSFEAHSVQVLSNAPAPSHLELRVRGGACIPEEHCDVLIWVGNPAAKIGIEHSSNVEVSQETEEERFGIIKATLIVYGPEAEIDLVASRSSVQIARRHVRLPIALGGLAIDVSNLAQIHVDGLEASRPLLVDAYRDGHWERTGFVGEAKERTPFALPFPALEHGTWQIQVRSDPFSSANAASRIALIANQEGNEIVALAQAALARDPQDEFAKRIISRPTYPEDTSRETREAFLAASLERFVYPQPEFASSRTQNAPRVQAEMKKRAVLAAIVIGAFAFLIVGVMLRRGFQANKQAWGLMALASGTSGPSGQEKVRTTISVILIAISAGIVFAGGAIVTLRLFGQ